MQKSITCFAFFIFGAIGCIAQANKPDSTAFRPHWEIGVDLLPLIGKENAPANSLFARRNYFQEKGRGRAWRVRAGVEVEVRDFTDVSRPTPDTYRTYEPYLSVGHEWQREVGRGFRWFVGVDGFGSYYRQKFEYLSFPLLFTEGGFSEVYKIGIAGTIGFQVKLFDNLYLSSEANLSGFYRRYKFISDGLPIGTIGGHSEELEKVLAAEFRPLYVINLIYSIKSIHHENKKT